MIKQEPEEERILDAPPPYDDPPPEFQPDTKAELDSSDDGEPEEHIGKGKEDDRQNWNGLGQVFNVYETGYQTLKKTGIVTGPDKSTTLYEFHPMSTKYHNNSLVLYKGTAPVSITEEASSSNQPNLAGIVAMMSIHYRLLKTECEIEFKDGKKIAFNSTSQWKAQFEFKNPEGTITYMWKLNGAFSLKYICINKATGEQVANLRRITAMRKTAQILIQPSCPESHEFMLAIALVFNRWLQVYNDGR